MKNLKFEMKENRYGEVLVIKHDRLLNDEDNRLHNALVEAKINHVPGSSILVYLDYKDSDKNNRDNLKTIEEILDDHLNMDKYIIDNIEKYMCMDIDEEYYIDRANNKMCIKKNNKFYLLKRASKSIQKSSYVLNDEEIKYFTRLKPNRTLKTFKDVYDLLGM